MMSLYDFEIKRNDGALTSLNDYKGKVLLIVNTATHCGFTPQYEGLEHLYQTYHDQGFEVLDFPSNQFAKQAPESDEEINTICELTYHTTFPRFAKIDVNGKHEDPLFSYLKKHSPVELNAQLKKEKKLSKLLFGERIKWNFTKFLVNQQGDVVARFSPQVKPEMIDAYIKDLF